MLPACVFFPALHTLRAVNSELQLPQRSWNVYGFVLKCLRAHTHTHHLPPKCHPLPSPPLHTLSTKLGSAGITELCWRPFFNSLTHQSFRSSAVHKDSFLSKGGSMGEDFCGWQQSQQRVCDCPPKWTIFLRGSVSNSRMRKAGFSCCRGNQITNTGYRLGKRRDAETKIKGGREEENPLENFRAMNCFTTLSSNRTVPSAKLSSAVLVSTRYLPPTQFVILGDLCFSKQEEIFRDREEKKLNTHHTT